MGLQLITAGIFGEFLEAKIFPAMSPEVTWLLGTQKERKAVKEVGRNKTTSE